MCAPMQVRIRLTWGEPAGEVIRQIEQNLMAEQSEMVMRKQQKKDTTERPFMNLSVAEMSAAVQEREARLNQRNCLLLLLFFGFCALGLLVGIWFYGGWMVETLAAAWAVLRSLWALQWWQAATLILEYRLSFFLLGIGVGFLIFLFIMLQIGELLIELLWDGITSLFS